ncbi:hypothetical protein [Spirulina subsalsa]|uniref:hypothetical protein n=1 Tax=Spirulina subsalsa TaxID=54311 RepID=UPI0002EA8175|nr:hypothetical protein [Spirulina subsalsa]
MNQVKSDHKTPPKKQRKSPWILFLLVIGWSLLLGTGMAQAMSPKDSPASFSKSVDPIPSELRLAAEVYLDNCSSCHLALPPEVFPTETWRDLLQNPNQHYGVRLPNIFRPEIYLMWQYLSAFSRPHQAGETVPFRVTESRFFAALHPKVEFPQPPTSRTCVSCHYRANEYDFRALNPEWENAP